MAFEFCEEEKQFVLAFAGRLHPSFTGRGLWTTFRRLCREFSLAVEPSAKTQLTVAPLRDALRLIKIHHICVRCSSHSVFSLKRSSLSTRLEEGKGDGNTFIDRWHSGI